MMIIGCDLHTRYQQIAMAGGPPLRSVQRWEAMLHAASGLRRRIAAPHSLIRTAPASP